MDTEYDRKFEEMKKYIPFLESMIKRLEDTSGSASTNPRQAQLDKIRSLRDLLLNKNKRMKMENLLKCEQVLVNLYAKVERDPSSNVKTVEEKRPTESKNMSDLETVRNKLKTVTKIQEGAETLPEIARANDIELNYTGSKEPALFQRRPNKFAKSPERSDTMTRSPQGQHKRNYTRLLVSPDRSPSRWPTSEESSEKPLFSRRSPPKTSSPPQVGKKEKKKSKASKNRKTNDLNITLNVPQESLNSLNTEDILSRIINCKDGDVDIDTLRELRTQILGELKQTGKNDDISDLILKSYNIKSNPRKKVLGKNSKEDVEEGELSDSESEAIESIYGSLPVINKNKKTASVIKTIENKDQQRKIQICLVISDKVERNTTNKTNEESQVIDLVSELEICSNNEEKKNKDIISIDSDTPSSSPLKKEHANKKDNENNKTKTKKQFALPVTKINPQKITECITLEDDELEDHTIEAPTTEDTNEPLQVPDSNVTDDIATLPEDNTGRTPNKDDLEHNQNSEQVQETAEQSPKFVANFYKPIEEQQNELAAATSAVTDNIIEKENASKSNVATEPVQAVCVTSTHISNNPTITRNTDDCPEETVTATSTIKTFNKVLTCVEKETQIIPLLNEPTLPPKVKPSVLSEIDILQALKNEILSGSISMPGTEVVTPALHQPKLTKVANAQEVMPKKKISIEKYKEKVSTSLTESLFYKKRIRANRIKEDINRKQSLKLTEKECERFNFPKRLSLDDDQDMDDIDDISDDDFLTEDKDESLGIDDIYGNLAPKSPDDEILNKNITPPVIIPTDKIPSDPKMFEENIVRDRGDIDMRALLPSQPQSIPQPVPPPFICGTLPSSPGAFGIDRSFCEVRADSNKAVADINRFSNLDPRKRRDLNLSAISSPNPYAATNTENTLRSFASVVANAPNMTPSRIPNMNPSYIPNIPQLRTPNARTFEMTPSHQTFELEEPIASKHVYAPSFPMSDNQERESSVSKDVPYWDMTKCDPRSRRNPRSNSNQNDGSYTPRYEDSYVSKYDKYNNRVRSDKYNTQDRRESYSKADCPTTPIPSFGWSECPPTPISAFGRQDAPMTPSHPFGRGDCPSTPSSGFGRNVEIASNHSYTRSECPPTPSHSFGRSECPKTPSHPFGRNECPRTPSHPFGRSENIPYNRLDIPNNSQTYSKDPRLNRRPAEYESSSNKERDYKSERDRKSSSYKSQGKQYSGGDSQRNYERERSIGRNDRDYGGRDTQQYERNKRDETSGPSTSRDVDNNRLYYRNRKSRYDGRYSKHNDGLIQNQREKSVSRSSDTKQRVGIAQSITRAHSVGRSSDKVLIKDDILFQSETGKNFTINTSVKTTFQDFAPTGKPKQVFEYSFDARRQRASSVGRSLRHDSSVGPKLSTSPVNDLSYSQDRNKKFKRASSVGRDMVKKISTLQEVKAELKAFNSKLVMYKDNTSKESTKHIPVRKPREVKSHMEAFISKSTELKVDINKESQTYNSSQLSPCMRKNQETSHQGKKSKENYSSKTNYRDPRMRKEHSVEIKSRYKIDRRSDSCDRRKSGIIYSNDNIAKGTSMGSGFEVKNYKIPKIKRVEPEVLEEKTKEKEMADSVEKTEMKKNTKESVKKSKQKVTKEPIRPAEEPALEIDSTNQNESKHSINIVDESEARVTRSKKKTDLNKSKDDADVGDVGFKVKKSKKPIIYDSDSDSVQENEVTKSYAQAPASKINSPSKKAMDIRKVMSPVIAEDLQKDAIEEPLDPNFRIEDIEIFSENIEANSVIDNINALIADLDNDLNTSKTGNDTFPSDIGKMMESIDSPESNSLGDISEVIEKDLNKSHELQQNFIDDILLDEKCQNLSETNQYVKAAGLQAIDLDVSQNDTQLIDINHPDIKQSISSPKTAVSQPNISKNVVEETSKVNEAIVSTSEINQKINKNNVQTSIEIIHDNDDQYIPDSTISKSVLNKINVGSPDSTNEIICERSSDVTSTYDTGETSNKESEIQSNTQKETITSIGNLLSILQDKSKIKELLAMLGNQSSENEKIKKKLEKLSEIVSDNEEEEEKKLDGLEDTTVEVKLTKESGVRIVTDETKQNDVANKNVEISLTLNEKKVETETSVDANIEDIEVKSSNTNVRNITDDISMVGKSSEIQADGILFTDKLVKNVEKTSNIKTQIKTSIEENNETDKLDDGNQSDAEDDEPLVKKTVTKKGKGKKISSGKLKTAPTKTINKRVTRGFSAKGIKKRGELQKLQEDIKEMFMRDDILNTTGIRMCRLAKMGTGQENSEAGPVVVLGKDKEIQDQPIKIRKKPGPKPKNKVIVNKAKPPKVPTKVNKPKSMPKYKPGPKSKTKLKSSGTDPYEFDTDSVTDINTTKESDDNTDSENESLASSHSFGSSEVLSDTKKKPRRKRRGIGGWKSGVIKSKTKKKKEQKQDISKNDFPIAKSQKPITIPDLNCFTDKTYCFQKGVATYDCRLCVYSGVDIINHYKKQHPHNEIPLSRMNQKTAELAILQCEQSNFQVLSKISSDKYTCRFCHKEFGNTLNVLEKFFWHVVSNHTGEFIHLCSECVNVTRCPFNLDIPPPPKDGQLIGYICQKCNFTQVSLENLKTHVIERHNDEQTAVFTINLAVMSNKAMNSMFRRVEAEQSRVPRSLRSNRSATDSADIPDDRSDISESSGHNSDRDPSEPLTQQLEQIKEQVVEQKPEVDQIKAKLRFESEEPSDDSPVKIKLEDRNEMLQFEDAHDSEINETNDSHRGKSDEIVDYPHFKLNYTESGAKEYVCCINGNDSHYKTSLLISMKKHIQSKHSENWDGYCSVCKVIVTLQGVQSDFRDCLSHFLDKHMDDFPVLKKTAERAREETEASSLPGSNIPNVEICVPQIVPSAVPLSLAVPTRIATPPVERTASPSYLAVRPLAELISKELRETESPELSTPISLPKFETDCLGEETVPPAQPSPSYPTNTEPALLPEKPFLYEEVQAEVMSKKHRVVLDTMMSRENLVRVFKCAGRFCSFTTDSPEDALLHASTHQRVGGEGAMDCAYCNYDACNNGIDLVMHVFKEHSRCQYCCPMCFYRAAASQLVAVHYAKAHSGAAKLQNVLRSTTGVTPPAPGPGHTAGQLTRDVAVQHFICNHDEGTCNFKTYTPGKFIEHLQQRHTEASSHPCNLCPTAAPSPAELVLHLRSHGLKLYQCTWCVHGANNESELLVHAAAHHPDTQPHAYVRLITSKEGGKRVLPLAYLNKFKMPAEDVVPNSTKVNPVKEAERSIELEKLIAHTMMMTDASTSQSADEEDPSIEEPMEIPDENESVEDSNMDKSLYLMLASSDQPKTTTELVAVPAEETDTANTQNEPANTQNEPVVVKAEPAEKVKILPSTDVICLDSDDEPDAPTEEAPATSNDEASSSVKEAVAQKISPEVSRSSVTVEVSITKVTKEVSTESSEEAKQNENKQILNIIDLSDDDPAASNAAKPEQTPKELVDKDFLYKCPNCRENFKTAPILRKHVRKSCVQSHLASTKCPHQQCKFVALNLNKLVAHYVKVHSGVKKTHVSYFCGVCNVCLPSLTGAKLHIRSVHKVSNYTVSMGIDNNGGERYTIKESTEPTEPVRISGRKTSTEIQRYQAELGGTRTRKPSAELKKRYGIDDIDKLPISPILDSQVYCDLCEFGTKVRLNLVRHLQQHSGNVPVPDTAPVNPVPHLQSNEMHFDKMVNLASSSVASRAPDKPRSEPPAVSVKIPAAESSRYPKYVAERLRYSCGAKDCSYISVDMAMFRCHWETLHSKEEEYRCVHCPPNQALTTSIALCAARILSHLRMHDVNLYACSACTYYHYRKHLVEKHLAETHPNGTVKVVREEYQPEAAPTTAVTKAGAPTMDLKPWQCGLCEFSSMLRPTVVGHCSTEHQSKMQFKCGHCMFRSSAKENVVKHQTNAHPALPEEVYYYFYKEGSIPDEDGIPRWQKQRQKMRLDERVVKTEPEPVNQPRPATPASLPAPVAVDLNIVKEEKSEEHSLNSELSLEELCEHFGQFCEPDGIKYKCSLCNAVRDHSREAMQCHLYEELNYRRWECVICLYKAFHKNGLNEHMESEHSRQFISPRALPVDVSIEKWVLSALDHQAKIIETNLSNLSVQKIINERTPATAVKKPASPIPASNASEAEMQNAFGEFGSSKDSKYACPKCEFTTKDEAAMVTHLESELSKIRWGCPNCSGKYQTFHEAQFHCKSAHTGQPACPKEAVRDPSLRSGWVKAVVSSQKQFIKCMSETNREPSPEKSSEDDPCDNSLLVALYDEPVHLEEQAVRAKRPATTADSDDERLVIVEPPTKKANDRKCPFCDYNIQNSRYIREHILKEHYNMKPYRCCYCAFEGTRQAVTAHTNTAHSDLPKDIVTVEVPKTLPGTTISRTSEIIATTTKRDKEPEPAAPAKIAKRDVKETEEVAKKVCLYCEKSVPETETSSHTHGTEKAEFAKRGEVVVKCCKCLVLRVSITSLQEHFDACHPGEKVLDNYAYFRLQVDTREIHCCGHCYKKFKFLRDLKVHHSTIHTSLSLSFTSIPFSHNLHTEGDTEVGKRKAEDAAGPSTKRVALKSTAKLPNSTVAKKSTGKPTEKRPDLELPQDEYKDANLNMPASKSVAEVDVNHLSGLKTEPKVVVKDYRS